MTGDEPAVHPAPTEPPAGPVRINVLTYVVPIPAVVVFAVGAQRLGALPVWVQWLLVTAAFLSSLGMSLALVLPRWRQDWLAVMAYRRENVFSLLPSVLAVWPTFVATTGFALMLDHLYRRGIALAEPTTLMGSSTWPSFTYFVWNLLNAIPYLELPRTLSWELGFKFTDHLTPVLLLAYKILIIGPVIALGVTVWEDASALWKRRRTKGRTASE